MDGKSLEALERLGRLRDAGALSEDEFQAQKQAIFNRQSEGPAESSPVASTVDQVAASSRDFPGPSAATSGGREAVVPVWARKKRGLNPSGIAVLLALIFMTTFGAAMWFLNRADNETYSFMATGPANVRDAPTATEGRVVAKLGAGDFVVGRVQGAGDTQWVEIAEGPLEGRFVWAGNLVTESAGDVAVEVAEQDSGPASGTSANASQPGLAVGEYRHFSDGSGNATQAQVSSVCLGADMRGVQFDNAYRRRPYIPMFAMSDTEAKFADRSNVASFRTRLDSQRKCVADMRWVGAQDGNSIDVALTCFVAGIEVSPDGSTYVTAFDPYGCG